jgi:hypothetical protein
MTENTSNTQPFKDETKIGEYAAQQPLSGVSIVVQSGAVNGHGGVVFSPKEEKTTSTAA